jgi:hypothetical protein
VGIFWSSGRYYVKRGEHLGKFRQCADAVAAAKALARANADGTPVPAEFYGSLTSKRKADLDEEMAALAEALPPPPSRRTRSKRGRGALDDSDDDAAAADTASSSAAGVSAARVAALRTTKRGRAASAHGATASASAPPAAKRRRGEDALPPQPGDRLHADDVFRALGIN